MNNSSNNKCNVLKDNELAKYTIGLMQANNVKMYGSQYCGYCTQQRKEFDNHNVCLKKNKIYVNCDDNNDMCKGVEGFPTWEVNGVRQAGYNDMAGVCNFVWNNRKNK